MANNSINNKSRRGGIRYANTNYLSRVLIYLDMTGIPVTFSLIAKGAGVNTARLKGALSWLVGYGLIKKEKGRPHTATKNWRKRDVWMYSLHKNKRFK